MARFRARGRWIFSGLFLAGCWFFLIARAVDRDLNHDEHQFLAPAMLIAREGLLPYRDFPMFHLPNLVFAYATLDALTHEPILMAKLLSAFVTGVLVTVIFLTAAHRREAPASLWPQVLAAAVVLLLLCDPIFLYTTGKTWNHEVPAALAVGAFLCSAHAFTHNRLWLNGLGGLMLGLAVGMRLTFAPLVAPLLIGILLSDTPGRRRVTQAAIFAAGVAVTISPTLYTYLAAPEAFSFGNFEFPRLRLLDESNTRVQKTVTWWRKLRYFSKEVLLPSLPLFFAFAAVAIRPGWNWMRRQPGGHFPSALLLLTLPFLLAGSFAPSRYQYQHHYALIPFLALGVAFSLQVSREEEFTIRTYRLVGLACVGSLLLCGRQNWKKDRPDKYDWIAAAWQTDEWFSSRAAALGREIRAAVPHGKVLTLAPTWPLVGGLRIYPELATGVFAWRSAALVPAERRRRLKLVAPADLEMFLAPDPPAAILTGVEDDEMEEPLIAYAKRHGYHETKLRKKRYLWLPASEQPASKRPLPTETAPLH